MQFDAENTIVKLCADGMLLEGSGNAAGAADLFKQAWQLAASDLEKFIAAHYLARHQPTPAEKLHWDETALHFALQLEGSEVKDTYPSLYLNIAKGYEDLGNTDLAKKNYNSALEFSDHLPADGYGAMIRGGIENGLKRL